MPPGRIITARRLCVAQRLRFHNRFEDDRVNPMLGPPVMLSS